MYFLPIKGEKGEVGPPGQMGGAGEPALNVSIYVKYFYQNVHFFIIKATLFCYMLSLWFPLHHCKTDKFYNKLTCREVGSGLTHRGHRTAVRPRGALIPNQPNLQVRFLSHTKLIFLCCFPRLAESPIYFVNIFSS